MKLVNVETSSVIVKYLGSEVGGVKKGVCYVTAMNNAWEHRTCHYQKMEWMIWMKIYWKLEDTSHKQFEGW